jgi:hypothetical protein
VHERDVTLAWRNLFQNKKVSAESVAQAEQLLDGLSGESPLHLRLANELEELRGMVDGAPKPIAPKKKPRAVSTRKT